MDKTMYTPKEAAEQLGVSDQTIYNWIARQIIRAESRGVMRKFYSIPSGEIERMRRIGEEYTSTGKATPALTSA